MTRYELIFRLDGALRLRIIFKPLLTQKWQMKINKNIPNISKLLVLYAFDGSEGSPCCSL